ncbi:hypothetical protein FT641_18750 [Bacillus paranthracis]|uniref:hypothetical protein n=1 Tax=Bacillus paranthracis TaxID=2026186 RepID=UPI00187A34EB|nr:hypothetical protein [Bacillus paranthracis]MBE7114396.1 hypothetical protein [Bacillus paranthracis]MBE7154731.1 hypothetical protein [Bacillus paranthracis]
MSVESRLKEADERIKESEARVKGMRVRYPSSSIRKESTVKWGAVGRSGFIDNIETQYFLVLIPAFIATLALAYYTWVTEPEMRKDAINGSEATYVEVLEKNRNDSGEGNTLYEIRVDGKDETIQLSVDGHTYNDLKIGDRVAITKYEGKYYVKEE